MSSSEQQALRGEQASEVCKIIAETQQVKTQDSCLWASVSVAGSSWTQELSAPQPSMSPRG